MFETPIPDNEDASITLVRLLVTDRCAPELEELYVQLNNILIDINFPIHLDELSLILSKAESHEIDNLEIVSCVETVLRTAINRALLELGIEFDNEIKIEKLVEAADVLLRFDVTDNPTLLDEVMEETEDDIDGLCRLLELLGTFEYDAWFEEVLEVSDVFVQNLRKLVQKEIQRQESPVVDPQYDQLFLKRIGRLMAEKGESFAADLVVNNVGIGASLESLYGCHVGRFIDMKPEDSVPELYALAAMSSESFESARVLIGHCLDDLYTEPMERSRAERLRTVVEQSFQPIFGTD